MNQHNTKVFNHMSMIVQNRTFAFVNSSCHSSATCGIAKINYLATEFRRNLYLCCYKSPATIKDAISINGNNL